MNYAAIREVKADQVLTIISVHIMQKSHHVRMQPPLITSLMEPAEIPTLSITTVLKPISSQTLRTTNVV